MSVGQKFVSQMFVSQMFVGQMFVGQMFVDQNVCRSNRFRPKEVEFLLLVALPKAPQHHPELG